MLQNPGSGDTTSSAELPLSTGSVDGGSLPNFDTDRDSEDGLRLAKDGAGLSTGDLTNRQDWIWDVPAGTPLRGSVTVAIDVAADDLEGGERIGLVAGLYACRPSCTLLTSATWSATSVSGAFSTAAVDLGAIDVVLSTGDRLRLRIAVPDSVSDVDVVLAYDTGTHLSRLTVTP